MTETIENNKIKNNKNKPDNIIDIHLLKIITTPITIFGNDDIKTLGMPNYFFIKYINIKIVKLNYNFLKFIMVD